MRIAEPGSGKAKFWILGGKKSDVGSGINIQDPQCWPVQYRIAYFVSKIERPYPRIWGISMYTDSK
jgi:hypothetical protein